MRTSLHSSLLVRTLADLSVLAVPDADHAFAEKLSRWIDIAGAIGLRASHSAPSAATQLPTTACTDTPSNTPVAASTASRLSAHVKEVQQALQSAMATSLSASPGSGRSRQSLPAPKPDMPPELAAAYEPYRRYYQAQQREMDLKIAPLRSQLREALAGGSAAQRQLASMDAALDKILGVQEARLLAGVPTLLEQRFRHLRSTHQQALAEAGQADPISRWMKPGGWLAQFCQELHRVLLAELDLRLQPTLGLLDALASLHTQAA